MNISMLTIVKVKSGTGRTQRIPVNGAEMTFATLFATLERDVDFMEKSSQLTYKDDEGDWCLLVDDSSLGDAVALGVGVNGCLSLRARSVGTDEIGSRGYSPGLGTMRGGGVRGSFGCPTRDLDDAGMVDAGMGGFSPEMAMGRHHRMKMCRQMMGHGDIMRMKMMKRMWMNEMMNMNEDEMQRMMIQWCRFMKMAWGMMNGWGMTQPQTSASEAEESCSSGRWANCRKKWGRWGCHRRGSGFDKMGEISETGNSDWQGSNMWRGVILKGIINRPWLPCLMAYSKNGVLTDETLASVLVWGLSALIQRLRSLASSAESVEELNLRLRDMFPQTVKMVHSVVNLLVCRMSTEASVDLAKSSNSVSMGDSSTNIGLPGMDSSSTPSTMGVSIRDGRSNSVGLGVSFDNSLPADSILEFIKELELVDKCEEQTKMMVALAVVPTLKIELEQFFVHMKTVAIDDRVVTHHGLVCAECKVQGFIGPKFVCTKCGGGSYVLCGNCYATRFDGSHDLKHTFCLSLRSPGVVANQGKSQGKSEKLSKS